MKWFSLARKATRRVLNSQRFDYHVGSKSGSHFRHVQRSESIVWSKSMEVTPYSNYQMQSANSCHRYSTTSEARYRLVDAIKNENESKKVDLEIISREVIKPVSPTPHHLRNFNLSIIDQILYDYYTPIILIIPNSNKDSLNNVMSKRSKHLKQTLSQILCQFYPLAGEVKDRLHIECNDKGVNYIEARVYHTLEEFLDCLDDEKLKNLMIESPRAPSIGNFVLGIQINIFNCGGIGISTSMSHKIMDFHTYKVFMKAWAAAVRGAHETISPSFVASEVFPNDPNLEYSIPTELTTNTTISTKRFVFDPKSVTALKAQMAPSTSPTEREPTRMEATTALIWKAAAKASSKVTQFSSQSPHALLSVVHMLKKASPPLPENSISNIFVLVGAVCYPESQPDLATLMGELRKSIASVNFDYIEALKGEKRSEAIIERLIGLSSLTNMTITGDFIMASSVLNSGIYELDFGWGKPIWFNVLNTGNASLVVLTDTHKRGGVEAAVTLSPDKMKIFERDHELLSYASVDPSPMLSLNH